MDAAVDCSPTSVGNTAASNGPLRLLFLHANGYPSGIYRQFLNALADGAQVDAPPIIETPPSLMGKARWPAMTDTVAALLDDQPEPVTLVGHSMGGFLSLMAAVRRPEKVNSIVLIDSPIVTGWRSLVFRAAQNAGLAYRMGPSPIALRRKFAWSDAEEARQFFLSKAFVRRWNEGVLDDFLAHALVESDADQGKLMLRVPRETEADIYAHLPTRPAARACDQLQADGMAVSVIAGSRSEEFELAGRQNNVKRFGSRFHTIDGHHLVPLERPAACARLVLDCATRV